MYIGIVGSEKAKFTPETEDKARAYIRLILREGDIVVSGACHLGGIDIWAKEEGEKLGLAIIEYAPEKLSWEYYKERNLKIAKRSDIVYCITVEKLPDDYKGMRFEYCYHCHSNEHIKSGGCWTVKEAIKLGKKGIIKVIK